MSETASCYGGFSFCRKRSSFCTQYGKRCKLYINPHGKIERVAPEFCEAFVIGKVPVIDDNMQTIFTRTGDWAGIAEAALSCFILIMQTFIVIIKKIKNYI